MNSPQSKNSSTRIQSYKHHGKDSEELRRRRTQLNVSLRKTKRDEQIQFKRNLQTNDSPTEDESDDDDDSNHRRERRLSNIRDAMLKAENIDLSICFQGIRAARKLLAVQHNPPIDEFINLNLIPRLVQCLSYDHYPDLQFEAAWAITNIASGNSQQAQAVVDANALPYLLRLLYSTHSNICEQAVWAIGNLIGDSSKLRDYAIELGVLHPLITLIAQDLPISLLRNVTWVIVNLCRHKDQPLPMNIIESILPVLKYLLSNNDVAILVDCIWALIYVLDCGSQMIQLVIDSNMIPDIMKLLNHTDSKVVRAALRAVGNIVTGTDEQTQHVINHGVLYYLSLLLKHPKNKLNKEAMWLLSNITAGDQRQIQAVIDAQLIPDVVHHLQYSEIPTQKEAAWCVSNFTLSGSVQHIQYIVNQGVIGPLCNLLQQQDVQLLQVCLDALCNILKQMPEESLDVITTEIEECGGLDKLENLQTHSNDDIYRQSYEIIEKYFPTENDEDDGISSMNQTVHADIFSYDYQSDNQTVPDISWNESHQRFHF